MSEDYPKIMTRGGVEISVVGAADEADRRAEGFVSPLDAPEVTLAEPVAGAEALSEDEPTFGPPGDQTHRKRASKKR